MDRDSAHGLAGAGALLAAVSLAMPWYSVTVSDELKAQIPAGAPTSLGHQSGWEALGNVHWIVLALVVVAGLRGALTASPAVPALAAAGLLAIAGWRYLDPPTLVESLGGFPQSADPLTSAIGAEFVDSFAQQIGLALSPAYGLAAAAVGAGASLYASLNRG